MTYYGPMERHSVAKTDYSPAERQLVAKTRGLKEDERLLGLDDGSIWAVSARDRITKYYWLNTDEIDIDFESWVEYPYRLSNRTTGDSVQARYLGRPQVTPDAMKN